ncbi:hypothetical protein DES52_109156 [Deinococcus yavapaiensis KR-236]|uniref:DUF1795 domain-containing protein n=1 Tax=Deinococcus yavapaiensis KR-236 TaxID=694435 RepID=A0A318S6W2_9DEIO|nr:hypothetical protein DES52_109156 [Deinococcus yavapaiensis KR-236]
MRAFMLFLCSFGSVGAFAVPFENWDALPDGTWQGGNGACLLKEERHQQPLPTFKTGDDARTFAARLQQALFAQKLVNVVTQPVEREGSWGVLASYRFASGGAEYNVSQLYLSSNGLLRTFTGSVKVGEFNQCVTDMQTFVRTMAK